MTRLTAALICATALWPANLESQFASETTQLGVDSALFPVGEKLWFEAKIGLVRVGRATMEVLGVDTIRSEPTRHDKMDSWIGLEDFASRRFVQDFHEGGRERLNTYEIYPDSGFYRREGVDTTMVTSPHPLDDAAFFYFVRNIEMEPGHRYEFNNYFKPDRNPIVLEVLARDTIEVPAGRFPVLEVRPIIRGNGIFREAADARLWLTDDSRRIVVKIKSRFSFGVTITLRLTKIEGLSESEQSDGT